MEQSFSSFFFILRGVFLCLLWSSAQVGAPWCVHGQECEGSGKNTQRVAHGTHPTQGTGLLVFINFSVAELIFSMLLAIWADFLHTTELFSR